MSIIAQKYKVEMINFCDEAVPIPKLLKIADLLIKRDISLKWYTYSKFDAKLTDLSCEKLKESGCIGLMFGLESASQRVNDLMNKGVNVKKAQNIIDILKKHGISCNVSAMIGFPGETQEEMLETVDFLKSNFSPKFSAYLSIFSLNYGSYVYNNPEEFGITYIEDNKDYFYKDSYSFECKNQVPYETMMKIRNRYCGI